MRFRWKMKALEEYSDHRMLRGIVAERQSDCTNIYAPLYQRLQKLYNKLDKVVNQDIRIDEGTITIKVSQGVVTEVEGLPQGWLYEIIECDKYGEPLPPEDDK